jgi:hypothetical protein
LFGGNVGTYPEQIIGLRTEKDIFYLIAIYCTGDIFPLKSFELRTKPTVQTKNTNEILTVRYNIII